jgi:hypothetical protein
MRKRLCVFVIHFKAAAYISTLSDNATTGLVMAAVRVEFHKAVYTNRWVAYDWWRLTVGLEETGVSKRRASVYYEYSTEVHKVAKLCLCEKKALFLV